MRVFYSFYFFYSVEVFKLSIHKKILLLSGLTLLVGSNAWALTFENGSCNSSACPVAVTQIAPDSDKANLNVSVQNNSEDKFPGGELSCDYQYKMGGGWISISSSTVALCEIPGANCDGDNYFLTKFKEVKKITLSVSKDPLPQGDYRGTCLASYKQDNQTIPYLKYTVSFKSNGSGLN